MKNKFYFLVVALFFAAVAIAQTPQLCKYQGVARNSSGNALVSQLISLRLTIHQGSPSGTIVYQETQSTTTNQFGLFNVDLGGGTVVSGNFSTISWGTSTYYQETEMDATGGNSFTLMGTSQLLSVPYSLYSVNGVHGKMRFTASGTFTVPVGVTTVYVSMCGGGGGGGGGFGGAAGGGGGGGADAIIAEPIIVTPNQTITVTIGSGGIGNSANNGGGTAGGTSSFGTLNAAGGGGSAGGVGGTAGGSGGSNGSTVQYSGSVGGAGGGCEWGSGGGGVYLTGTGGIGGGYGGGGGGGVVGGNGSAGFILVEW